MGFYNDVVLPRLIDRSMRNKELAKYRRRIAGAAHGRVLEVGIGSGLNLPFYGSTVTEIIGLEPSQSLIEMASQRAKAGNRPISFLTASAEAIPLDTGSVDAVVTTWTMCSIPDAKAALAEMRRVLRPGGDLLFVEHGRAPDPWVIRFQDWLTPAWRPLTGGCHLNRPIADLITGAGFRMDDLRTGYAPGPKPFTFLYEGCAKSA
ncbi:class I SAM-dependent methyltransferase [Microvirga sp. HBU67558]|uniref:class I SAM-dependent methyltransferase n=1 Tax=Microvirga TaxID=186650 RepID=UPI001B382AF6|nr:MULTISPECIES: class I SAM-dependent methyltransferase [unclassified Microvirga]MBQ0821918.1 class I SAM-dependent methyltransferase [Microvirga sp. HBU67558]